MTADFDHEVRNVLALLRGHLELASELLASGHVDAVAADLADAMAAASRLEELILSRPVEDGDPRPRPRRGAGGRRAPC